jgi:DNA-binding response OmpR family regulator
MRVVVVSGDISLSPLGLAEALEEDPSVSRVEASNSTHRAGDADVAVIRGAWSAETVAPDLHSGSCVCVVVAKDANAGERIRLLDDGADVVLHGDVPDDEIVAQVRAIARRRNTPIDGIVRPPEGQDKIVLEPDRRHAVVLGRRVTLTALEGKLLKAFMDQPGVVLDGRALMTTVWGSPFGARSTISAYIRRLRVKIEPDPSNPAFIGTVWGGGYLYRPEGEE